MLWPSMGACPRRVGRPSAPATRRVIPRPAARLRGGVGLMVGLLMGLALGLPLGVDALALDGRMPAVGVGPQRDVDVEQVVAGLEADKPGHRAEGVEALKGVVKPAVLDVPIPQGDAAVKVDGEGVIERAAKRNAHGG